MAEDDKKNIPRPSPPKKVEEETDPVQDAMELVRTGITKEYDAVKDQIASGPDILTTDHLAAIENVAERADIQAITSAPNADLVDLEGAQLSSWQAQNSPDKFLIKAKRVVIQYTNTTNQTTRRLKPKDLNIVWFSKTLQYWKALISTVDKDGLYFEVTYNAELGQTYVDVYEKLTNVVIED